MSEMAPPDNGPTAGIALKSKPEAGIAPEVPSKTPQQLRHDPEGGSPCL